MGDHPSVGGGQLLGPTITLGPFLQLSAVPYSEMSVSISVLQCSHSFHHGLFLRDLVMLRLALYFFWICLQIHGLCLLIVTASNYSAIADLHTLQITAAHRLVFSVCYILH
jgi:hypothetical protein